MPPGGYATIAISEETAEKLAQLMLQHELQTMSNVVKLAVDSARSNHRLRGTELAHLLYQRLRSSETHS